MNDYYTSPADIAAATRARSVDVNTIDASVDAAFDKLPPLAAMFTGSAAFTVDTGGQNALSFPVPIAVKALADGMQFRVKLANSINGAAVATAGALGTFPVRRPDGSALAGEVLAGQIVALTYLGGVFYAAVASASPVAANGLPIAGGTMTGPLNGAKGAAIASAAALDLQSASGNLVHVTGATAVTSVALAPGAAREVVFDGALVLTHSAALSLPGKANIVTQPGDRATFYGDSIGNVIVTKYQRADGNPVATQHGFVPIGALLAFDSDVQSNVYVTATGETYLKTGVIADASAYPLAPAGLWASVASAAPTATSGTYNITNIAAGNGIFVAGLASGSVAVSKEGWEWSAPAILPGAGASPVSVGFANGYFIAAVSGGIYRSTDGVNWTKMQATTAGTQAGPAYGNGRWVVVIANTTAFYTSDDNGATWTARALAAAAPSMASNAKGNTLIYGNQFVAWFGNTSYLTSPDGIAWTSRTGPAGICSIAYGAGIYVLTRYTNADVSNWSSSPDAITWTARGSGTTISAQPQVSYLFGKFFINDGQAVAYTSANGTAWATTANAGTNVAGNGVGGFVLSPDGTYAIGSYGYQLARLASNGINWMLASAGTGGGGSYTQSAIEWCSDRFVMCGVSGSSSYLEYSWDGKAWWSTYSPTPTNNANNAMAYLNGKFHLFSGNNVPSTGYFTSVDGFAWAAGVAGNLPAVMPSASGASVANGKLFVFPTNTTSAASTADGLTWTALVVPTNLRCVAYGNGIYVAFNPGTATYATSVDGVNWTAAQAFSFGAALRVVFASGYFVTATAAGKIYKSADGVNWTQLANFVYGYAAPGFTSLDTDGTTVLFQSNTDASITLWNGAPNDPLYRRGAIAALKSNGATTGFRCNPAGLFTAKDGTTTNYGYGQVSATPKVLNDINLKTYDAANVARTDFYKRVA
jgi:hypothetical protein